ncbi:u1 small nuclear ribonucleoprotein 70 kd [Anaeramoeba ignava]|uniref:U1 small nuclear ribonucleoprotein 70 kd n=1 Tax=Anaeramoeba ignava TaxID=1746090 RepID=A0A9Q0LQ98_ANAIG|nr:u1 small nuclear ribonucleoprotein 70 kd [Anaeramoeba ignava]
MIYQPRFQPSQFEINNQTNPHHPNINQFRAMNPPQTLQNLRNNPTFPTQQPGLNPMQMMPNAMQLNQINQRNQLNQLMNPQEPPGLGATPAIIQLPIINLDEDEDFSDDSDENINQNMKIENIHEEITNKQNETDINQEQTENNGIIMPHQEDQNEKNQARMNEENYGYNLNQKELRSEKMIKKIINPDDVDRVVRQTFKGNVAPTPALHTVASVLSPQLRDLFLPRPPLLVIQDDENKKPKIFTPISSLFNKINPNQSENSPDGRQFLTTEEKKQIKKQQKQEKNKKRIDDEKKKWNPKKDPNAKSNPRKTVFVGRINKTTSEHRLKKYFEIYGKVRSVRIVYDKVTGKSRGYGFVEYEHERDAEYARKDADGMKIDEKRIVVDKGKRENKTDENRNSHKDSRYERDYYQSPYRDESPKRRSSHSFLRSRDGDHYEAPKTDSNKRYHKDDENYYENHYENDKSRTEHKKRHSDRNRSKEHSRRSDRHRSSHHNDQYFDIDKPSDQQNLFPNYGSIRDDKY